MPLVSLTSREVHGVGIEACRRGMHRPAEFSTEVQVPTLFVYHDARPREVDARLHGQPDRNVHVGAGRLTILAPGERLSGVMRAGGIYAYTLLRLGASHPFLSDEAGISPQGFRSRLTEDDVLLVHLASRLVREVAEPAPERLLVESLRHSLGVLLARGARGTATPPRFPGALSARQLRQVLDYVEDRLHHDIGLSKLAAVTGVSADHFGRSFRAATGRTPHQHLTWRRVERAKHLLSQKSPGLAEIAVAVGFCDQSHFHRRFKAVTGLSPAQFRRQAG